MDRIFRLSLVIVTHSKTLKYTTPIMNIAEGHGVGRPLAAAPQRPRLGST